MNKTSIDYILDNYKGIRRDRALKVVTGQLKSDDKELKQFVLNELVRCRREIVQAYEMIEIANDEISNLRKEYKECASKGDIVGAAETQLIISDIENSRGEIKATIISKGKLIRGLLKAEVITEHEACQVFNINHKTCAIEKESLYKMDTSKEDYSVFDVIVITGCEYRHRKGRAKEFYDCPHSEMPIYWAIHEYTMDAMNDNKEFQEASDKAFKRIFPEVKTYTAVKDLEGNVIKIVEDEE
jgi:hypothetical protein